MKTRIASGLSVATLAVTILGCSSSRVPSPAPATLVTVPMAFSELPLPPLQDFKACTLGQSCMTMDDRPFEPCLLSTTRCADKIKEPILVELPGGVAPSPNSIFSVSEVTVSSE